MFKLLVEKSYDKDLLTFNTSEWKSFRFDELFTIKKGKRLTKADMLNGETPFIGSTDNNNGLTNKVSQQPNHYGNVITVNYNGSVGEAFYQPVPFWASDDVNVLYPKDNIFERFNQYIALFIIPIIKLDKFRFNYGRKWHKERMDASFLKLPVNLKGEIDVDFMERYIKSSPFSSKI
jgi:restriction endonuclease S subunit